MCLKIRRYTPLFFIYHIKNYIVWQYQICIFYGQNTAFSQKKRPNADISSQSSVQLDYTSSTYRFAQSCQIIAIFAIYSCVLSI